MTTDWKDVAHDPQKYAEKIDTLLAENERLERRIAELEGALEDLIVWAEHVKRRRTPQMGDPNSSAVDAARAALGGK